MDQVVQRTQQLLGACPESLGASLSKETLTRVEQLVGQVLNIREVLGEERLTEITREARAAEEERLLRLRQQTGSKEAQMAIIPARVPLIVMTKLHLRVPPR